MAQEYYSFMLNRFFETLVILLTATIYLFVVVVFMLWILQWATLVHALPTAQCMHAQVQIVCIIWTFHICDGEQWGQAPGDQAAADPIAAPEQFLLNISPSAYLRRTVSVGCLQI